MSVHPDSRSIAPQQFLTVEFEVSTGPSGAPTSGVAVDLAAELVSARLGRTQTVQFADVHVGVSSASGRWVVHLDLAEHSEDQGVAEGVDRPWVPTWAETSKISVRIVACRRLGSNIAMLERPIGRVDLGKVYWGYDADAVAAELESSHSERQASDLLRAERLRCYPVGGHVVTAGRWHGGWLATSTVESGRLESRAGPLPDWLSCLVSVLRGVSANAIDVRMPISLSQYVELPRSEVDTVLR